MSELRRIQKLVGEVLIPETRASQGAILTVEESLPLALEFYYTAFSMKAAHRQAGIYMADRFAERMGLLSEEVQAFALKRLNDADEASQDNS